METPIESSSAIGGIGQIMGDPHRDRILILAREFTEGGAAYLALRHVQRLLSRYEIDMVVTGACDESMLRRLPDAVAVFRLRAGHHWAIPVDALGYLERTLEYRKTLPFCRTYRAVLATSVFPDWDACLAFSLVHAPRKLLFLVDEGLALSPKRTTGEQSAIECCLLAADLVVPVSRRLWTRMAEYQPRLRHRPWQVLRPPIDDKFFAHALEAPLDWGSQDSPVVLTVARLSHDKQIMQCLKIHHQLRQAAVDFRWVVVGAGPEERRLRTEIKRLGMTDVFILAGSHDNVIAWMQQCDVFALLSASEGCPTVVMEAMLVGCAVIMTDVNGADELIDDGQTGLIVQNNAQAIAQGLCKLILDTGLRDQIRRNLAATPLIADPVRETVWLISQIETPMVVATAPTVSIIIPTFNHERYIGRAIASALMQDYPTLEVIVSDDGSTDQTELLARAWEPDPRFRYFRNGHNLGRVANYRKALTTHARGQWVLMLDGDDHLIDPGFIRQTMDSIQRHGDRPIVFAQAGHRVHYAQGGRVDVDITPPIDGSERVMTGAEYLRFVYKTGFFTHLGALYNREAALRHGFYTADISSSDMDSLLRLALEGEVLVLNTIAGCWVQHSGNASSNVPLHEIAANVRIFRQIASMAAQRGQTSMPQLDGVLTQYEARTLAHLFNQTLGKSARGPGAALTMLSIVISINPLLLLNRHIATNWIRYLQTLTLLAFKRNLSFLLPERWRKKTPQDRQ